MAGEQDPPEDDLDPAEDNQDQDQGDKADDAAGAADPVDYKAQYESLRAAYSRQSTELGQLRAQSGQASNQTDEASAGAAPGDDEYLSTLEQQAWALAGAVFGDEVRVAYEAVQPLLEKAATPSDWYAAMETYHERRVAGTEAPKKGSAKGATALDPRAPRVDSNRQDRSPDSNEAKLEEARKASDGAGFFGSAAALLGFGPDRVP